MAGTADAVERSEVRRGESRTMGGQSMSDDGIDMAVMVFCGKPGNLLDCLRFGSFQVNRDMVENDEPLIGVRSQGQRRTGRERAKQGCSSEHNAHLRPNGTLWYAQRCGSAVGRVANATQNDTTCMAIPPERLRCSRARAHGGRSLRSRL